MRHLIVFLCLSIGSVHADTSLENMPASCSEVIQDLRLKLRSRFPLENRTLSTNRTGATHETDSPEDFIRRVSQVYEDLFVRLYGDTERNQYQRHTLPQTPDRIRSKAKIINLLAREARVRIPMELVLKMDAQDKASEEQLVKISAVEEVARLKLADRYVPPEMTALQRVLQDGAVLGRKGVLSRLADFIRQSRNDYLAVRDYESLVDEWQARLALLIFDLIGNNQIDLSNTRVKSALDELLVCVFRETSDPLPQDALETFANVASTNLEEKISGAEIRLINQAIDNIGIWQKQLDTVRRRFVTNYEAAQMLLSVLFAITLPDGEKSLDLQSVLRTLVWVPDLTRYRRLHEVVLGLVADAKGFYHPATRLWIRSENVRALFEGDSLGEEGELILASQILTDSRAMKLEYTRWKQYALEARLDHIRSQFSLELWSQIEKDAAVLATSVAKLSAISSIASQIPKPFVDLILQKFSAESSDTKKPADATGKVLPIPKSYPSFIDNTASTPDESEDKKTPLMESGKASLALGEQLSLLESRAKRYYSADQRAQREALTQGVRLAFEKVGELDRMRRSVLQAVLKLKRSIIDCFISEKCTEADAEATLAAQVSHYTTLTRLIINDISIPELTSLGERLVCVLLRKMYSSSEGRRQLFNWLPTVKYVQQNRLKVAIYTAVVTAALGSAYFAPQYFENLWRPPTTEQAVETTKPQEREIKKVEKEEREEDPVTPKDHPQ